MLRGVINDLSDIWVNAIRLRSAVSGSHENQDYQISPKARLALNSIQRDLRESINRRTQAYELLLSSADRAIPQETWALFAVMTADIFKADRTIDALLSKHVRFPPEDYLRNIIDYLEVALQRAKEFEAALEGITVPTLFNVMLSDLKSACTSLQRLDLPDANTIQADSP